MNFDRLTFQSWIEHEVGCTDPSQWDLYKTQLANISIDHRNINTARLALNSDAISLYTKALISLISGIRDIENNQTGWGLIKLYYSLFYNSRAILCARNQGMVRNKCWHRFNLSTTPATCILLSSKKYRNDHEAALFLYEDLYGSSDIFLSNTVDNEKPYEWMMRTRNLVNYRLAQFPDPLLPKHIPTPKIGDISSSIKEILESFMKDEENTLTFQPENAWLAIPFKQILKFRTELATKKITGTTSPEKITYLEKLVATLPIDASKALNISSLFK